MLSTTGSPTPYGSEHGSEHGLNVTSIRRICSDRGQNVRYIFLGHTYPGIPPDSDFLMNFTSGNGSDRVDSLCTTVDLQQTVNRVLPRRPLKPWIHEAIKDGFCLFCQKPFATTNTTKRKLVCNLIEGTPLPRTLHGFIDV